MLIALSTPLLFGLSRRFLVEPSLAAIVTASIYFFAVSDGFRDRAMSRRFGVTLGLGLLCKSIFPLYLFAPVVEAAAAKLRPHAEALGFALETSTEAGLPDAHFDRDIVTQVIFNLVDNALKYARGAARKEIELACKGEPDGVTLSVRDFGPGVSNADLARIFQPFYRTEDELVHTTKGTGIGLALVKELVESMEGQVTAKNAPGGGLQVRILLARAAQA